MAPLDRLRFAAPLALLLLAALPACSSVSEGPAPDPVQCDVNDEPLASDDDALGFSPADVLARFGGVQQVTLEHYMAGTTDLSLELVAAGQARHISTSLPAGADPNDALEPCDRNYMQLPVELHFVTADGVFAERIPATWELDALPEFESVIADLELAQVKGSYTSDADSLSFNVTLRAGEPSGVVVGVIDVPNDLGTEFNVARFNTPTWPQTE
ncbi:hypothetical protein [Nannocystis sp.]|uniref:hypothetical protein n=1 Tax=Nannocystis sp. TaxID=1962667 RepID=UPI002420F245|nr:hypothetical protein [Nannocystis sp.]MBK7828701.1 hypothetical protein [Nannocystis sp.]MBK9753996.1 hypothetical protein [Nannocystis sp.]